MDITPLIPQGRQLIQSYGAGGFTVSNVDIKGAALILPEQAYPLPQE